MKPTKEEIVKLAEDSYNKCADEIPASQPHLHGRQRDASKEIYMRSCVSILTAHFEKEELNKL